MTTINSLGTEPAPAEDVLNFLCDNEMNLLSDLCGCEDGDGDFPLFVGRKDGKVFFYITCSDRFAWGTADAELVTVEGLELLKNMFIEFDAKNWFMDDEHVPLNEIALLWCARMRNLKPMPPYFERYPKWEHLYEGLLPSKHWA